MATGTCSSPDLPIGSTPEPTLKRKQQAVSEEDQPREKKQSRHNTKNKNKKKQTKKKSSFTAHSPCSRASATSL